MTEKVLTLSESVSLTKRLRTRFLRLNIAAKMLLGYFTLVSLIFLISVFSIYSLEKLNSLNRSIITDDLPLVDAADKMIDSLISQELYAHRYAILNSPEMLALSLEKSKEFDERLENIREMRVITDASAERIATLHSEYKKLFAEGVKHFRDPSSPMSKKYNSAIKKNQEELIGIIKGFASRAREAQNAKTLMTSRIGTIAFRTTAILFLVSIVLSVTATMLITRSIAGPIAQLKLATEKISEGRFDQMPDLRTQDELGDLSHSFNEMIKRLKRLEEMYLDANPLTRLPGSIAIENVLTKRLETDLPLAFCLIDMDNFKAYNDRYGYARGSEVIKAASKIITHCVYGKGLPDDFVGHIGGDDFALITSPDHFRKTCNNIIETFDEMIPGFYDAEDRTKGFIMGKTRLGDESRFPILSLSIAVVTNVQRKLSSAMQVGELAAELKEYAKTIPGSVYVVDRRRKDTRELPDENVIQFTPKASAGKKNGD